MQASAAGSRHRSTTYVPVGVGRWFQTLLYHPALAGTPPEEGNWNPLGGSFPTPLYHGSVDLAERPTSL